MQALHDFIWQSYMSFMDFAIQPVYERNLSVWIFIFKEVNLPWIFWWLVLNVNLPQARITCKETVSWGIALIRVVCGALSWLLIHAGRSSLLWEVLFPRQRYLNYMRQEMAEKCANKQTNKQEAWVLHNCLSSCLDVPEMLDLGL